MTTKIETLTDEERGYLLRVPLVPQVHAAEKALRIIDAHAAERAALTEQVAQLLSQLPDGMQHCTIRFVACEVGHGRLTATNWIDHGCDHCKLTARDRQYETAFRERAEAESEVARLRAENARLTEALAAAERREQAAEQNVVWVRDQRDRAESELHVIRQVNEGLANSIKGLHKERIQLKTLASAAEREVARLTEALAAAERRGAHFDEQCAANLARAEAAAREVARLTEALAAAEKKQSDTERWRGWERDRAEAAEARVRELEAENTTMRVNNRVLEADNADLLERRRAAESELAALRERVAFAIAWLTDIEPKPHSKSWNALEVLRGK